MKAERLNHFKCCTHIIYSWHKRITLYFPLVLAVFLEAGLSRHLIGSVPNLPAVERDHPTGSTSSSLASDSTFKLTHITEIYGISVTSRQTQSLTDSQRERAKKAFGISYFPLRVQWKEKNRWKIKQNILWANAFLLCQECWLRFPCLGLHCYKITQSCCFEEQEQTWNAKPYLSIVSQWNISRHKKASVTFTKDRRFRTNSASDVHEKYFKKMIQADTECWYVWRQLIQQNMYHLYLEEFLKIQDRRDGSEWSTFSSALYFVYMYIKMSEKESQKHFKCCHTAMPIVGDIVL